MRPEARPADSGNRDVVEYHQVDQGQWVVVVYGLIPKNGFGHLDFPYFWGDPAERPVWRAARTGEVPGGTFLFDSREQAVEIAGIAFPDQSQMFRYMGRREVPSLDDRRRAGRVPPREFTEDAEMALNLSDPLTEVSA